MPDSIATADSIIVIIGTEGLRGDIGCDSEGILLENYGLDINCIEYEYEGFDCYENTNRGLKNQKSDK